jgi:hypothetical protein
MKKAFLAILSILYLFSASGATVYSHYCMGKLVEIGLEKGHEKECGKCGMEKETSTDDGCCKEEQKFISGEQSQKAPGFLAFELPLQIIDTDINYHSNWLIPANSILSQLHYTNAPPRAQKVAAHIENCVFRI